MRCRPWPCQSACGSRPDSQSPICTSPCCLSVRRSDTIGRSRTCPLLSPGTFVSSLAGTAACPPSVKVESVFDLPRTWASPSDRSSSPSSWRRPAVAADSAASTLYSFVSVSMRGASVHHVADRRVIGALRRPIGPVRHRRCGSRPRTARHRPRLTFETQLVAADDALDDRRREGPLESVHTAPWTCDSCARASSTWNATSAPCEQAPAVARAERCARDGRRSRRATRWW